MFITSFGSRISLISLFKFTDPSLISFKNLEFTKRKVIFFLSNYRLIAYSNIIL